MKVKWGIAGMNRVERCMCFGIATSGACCSHRCHTVRQSAATGWITLHQVTDSGGGGDKVADRPAAHHTLQICMMEMVCHDLWLLHNACQHDVI
jgi:hypothetical protein